MTGLPSILRIISIIAGIFFFVCLNLGMAKYSFGATFVILPLTAFIIWCLYKRGNLLAKSTGKRQYYGFLAVTFFVPLVIECLLYQSGVVVLESDPLHIQEQAVYYLENNALLPELESYFLMYPYNVNLAILFSKVASFFGSYSAVVYICIILSNITALLTCLGVNCITNNNKIALISMVAFQIFSILTLRTYWPYSSNPGIFFVVLITYLYVCPLGFKWKMWLIPLCAAMGYYIKLTTLMPFIAVGCVELLMLVTQRKSYSISQIVAPCLFTILFFGCEKIVRTHAFSQVGYTHNDNIERGFWYYALLGQNNESGGQWDKHIAYEVGNHPGTRHERDAFFRDEAIKAISSRGVFGNVKFYIAKTSIAWGCTKMDILKTSNDHLNSILYYIRHFIWYFIMTMMCFTAIVVKRKKECAMLLALLGVLLYLLISECSFTYVIMYSPVVFILGGLGMHNLSNRQTK